MGNLELTILAVALAMDALSVAAAVGPACCPRWGVLRLMGAFGGFQALMPLLGAVVGAYLITYVSAYDHWVAFGLLELVGAKMVIEACRQPSAHGKPANADPSRGFTLLGLSLVVSMDAFGAGVGLRVAGANLWIACPLIGAVAAGLTYAGARLGATAENLLGRRAMLVGGLVLLALGFRMLRI